MSAHKQLSACLGLLALTLALLAPAAARAEFGIESFEVAAHEEGGAPVLQAGAHPDAFTVDLEMNLDEEGHPEGTLRELTVDLPPGMVGNPRAVPRCPAAAFEGVTPHCPISTVIGVALIKVTGFEEIIGTPVYNLMPRNGVAGNIGFSLVEENSFQEAFLRNASDYGVRVSDVAIPTSQEIVSVTETIWGVPADPSHDSERGLQALEGGPPASSQAPLAPFVTLPTSCGAPLEWTATVSSVEGKIAPADMDLAGGRC